MVGNFILTFFIQIYKFYIYLFLFFKKRRRQLLERGISLRERIWYVAYSYMSGLLSPVDVDPDQLSYYTV